MQLYTYDTIINFIKHAGFIPVSQSDELPPLMTSLYDSKYLEMPYHDPLSVCENVFDELKGTITEEQSVALEKKTRDQASCKEWFRHRAGRVTASRFKAACCTNYIQSALSLIKPICYPEVYKFKTAATR